MRTAKKSAAANVVHNNVTSYRVIYGDTDKMGIVYYANYLRLFERGRCELLRELGVPYGEIEARGIHFPVVEAHCRYAKPARYDDLVLIETELEFVSRATLIFSYRILREPDGPPLAEGSTKHACVDGAGKVVRIPADLARMLEQATLPATAAR
ncbi:MAG: acyl-CoA thioesterase [Deltaproteobacteria bacterium]|nr:acyl-CoA thioesterase [Deltaproteobacteria bacterium]